MSRSDRMILDFEELEAVLHDAQVCRLGIRDGEGICILPMSFGYRDRTLYFHSGRTGRKLDLLRANPAVSFEAEADVSVIRGNRGCNWSMTYRSVMGQGSVYFLEDPREKQDALSVITAHYGGEETDLPEKAVEETVVFAVVIRSITGKQRPRRDGLRA